MSSFETLGIAARLAWRDYRAVYSTRVLAISLLPRALLQVAFFALMGSYSGGEAGLRFAFVGATAHVMVVATVQRGPDTLVDERVFGTMWRLRLSAVPLPVVLLTRWWVYLAEALVSAGAAIVIVGLVYGVSDLPGHLLLALPLYLVTALSLVQFGLLAAAISVGKYADVLVTNLLAYLLLFCGVVAPLPTSGPLVPMTSLLPLTHGLLAIRAHIAGEAWLEPLGREVLVGLAWGLAGIVALQWQARRARRQGHDDYL